MFDIVWFNNALKINTIKCKNLVTIVSGRKNIARPFVRQKQVSTKCKSNVQNQIQWQDLNLLQILLKIFCFKQLIKFKLCEKWKKNNKIKK